LVRAYEFLSQIIDYDDRELEQLCVFAKHLHPMLRIDRGEEDDIEVSELALTHYRLTKRAEHELRLGDEQGDYRIKPLTDLGSGKPHDPEKKRLSEIIDRLNGLFGTEVGDEDQLQWANGIADRIERDDEVMEQVRHHDRAQVMKGRFPRRLIDVVLDAMQDNEKLSMQVLEDDAKGREFAMLILDLLAGRERSRARSSV
jgi:type I restriction enzyme R subunit